MNTNRNADVVETAFLTPSVEAITEFSVETNGFKPEFGQAGGGAITFASKSGTNQFQGSLYNFLRNDALDEKGFFERTKGIYRQNNFGGSWGGPVKIPRLYDGQNRTFFFAAYEGFLNKQASNALTLSVPTPEMYDGDFSNWVDSSGRMPVIYDPATTRPNATGTGFIRDPFPGNKIPLDRFSAVARQYLALARGVVVPNRPGLVPGTLGYVSNNYLSPGGTTRETTHKYSLKIDHTLSSAHRLAYLFNRTTNRAEPGASGAAGLPAPFNTFQSSSFDGDLHRGSWDWIVSPRMVNHLSVGVNTFNKNAFSPNVDQGWRDRICIPNAVDCNQNFGIVSFSEFSTWGASSYNGTEQPRFSIKDDLTISKGSHTIKSGFTFDRQQANGFGQQDIGGRAGFDFKETAIPGTTTLASGGGNSFASFLLGVADTGRTETIRYLQQIYPYGVYGSHLQAGLLNPNQVPMSVVNDLIARFGPIGARDLLNSSITSAAAIAAGITPPDPNFTNAAVQRSRTVGQALRPYPQYLAVNVQSGGGDKTGRSHYHAGVVKVNQRLPGAVSLQGSYTYSKLMTDADSFSGSGRALDAARPELEWSVGRLDQTHSIKINSVFELPFGEGRRWLTSGIASHIIGGWRIAVIQAYSSGFPIGVVSNAPLNIFNGTNRPNVTGADWRAPIAGDEFDPRVDSFLNRAAFVQPVGELGNAPRMNPDVRGFWNLTENLSVARTINLPSQIRMDIRLEAFNIFNRVVFATPTTSGSSFINFSSPTFGVVSSQSNTPRQMQIGLKLYW